MKTPLCKVLPFLHVDVWRAFLPLFPPTFPPSIGRRAVYVSLHSEESHEKQMDFKIEIKTDALPSSQSYCKDLVKVVEILDIPMQAVKANPGLSQACLKPSNVSCVPCQQVCACIVDP